MVIVVSAFTTVIIIPFLKVEQTKNYHTQKTLCTNIFDSLAPNYDIAPVAIESLGAIGPLSRALLKDLGRRIKESTGEARAHSH